MENTNEPDPAHETIEDPEREDPSRPRPLAEVAKGDGDNNASDADPIVGGTGKEVLGELNTSDTIGDSKKEFTNKINPSFGTMGDVGKDRSSNLGSPAVYPGNQNLSALGQLLDSTEDPEQAYRDELDPSSETTGDPGKDTSSNFNPSVKFPVNESSSELESLFDTPELPAQKDPSEADPSIETSIDSETSEDHAQPNDADKSDGLPQQNDETDKLDPFHISPNQLHRIEAALSLSAQEARLPPELTQTEYGHSNNHGSPDPFGAFGPARQTEPFPGSQPTQILNLQSSILNNHAITATSIPASGNFRTALPVNGTLDTPSASANGTERTAISSPSSASITAGSGINSPSAARTDSSVSKDRANMASDVGAMKSRAWIALGLLMLLGMFE